MTRRSPDRDWVWLTGLLLLKYYARGGTAQLQNACQMMGFPHWRG